MLFAWLSWGFGWTIRRSFCSSMRSKEWELLSMFWLPPDTTPFLYSRRTEPSCVVWCYDITSWCCWRREHFWIIAMIPTLKRNLLSPPRILPNPDLGKAWESNICMWLQKNGRSTLISASLRTLLRTLSLRQCPLRRHSHCLDSLDYDTCALYPRSHGLRFALFHHVRLAGFTHLSFRRNNTSFVLRRRHAIVYGFYFGSQLGLLQSLFRVREQTVSTFSCSQKHCPVSESHSKFKGNQVSKFLYKNFHLTAVRRAGGYFALTLYCLDLWIRDRPSSDCSLVMILCLDIFMNSTLYWDKFWYRRGFSKPPVP